MLSSYVVEIRGTEVTPEHTGPVVRPYDIPSVPGEGAAQTRAREMALSEGLLGVRVQSCRLREPEIDWALMPLDIE